MRHLTDSVTGTLAIWFGNLIGGISFLYYWLDTHSGFMISMGTMVGIASTCYGHVEKQKARRENKEY